MVFECVVDMSYAMSHLFGEQSLHRREIPTIVISLQAVFLLT